MALRSAWSDILIAKKAMTTTSATSELEALT
jgi:hypothetical protein